MDLRLSNWEAAKLQQLTKQRHRDAAVRIEEGRVGMALQQHSLDAHVNLKQLEKLLQVTRESSEHAG